MQYYKFSYHLHADTTLKPYLKQTDPNVTPVINIAHELRKKDIYNTYDTSIQ